MPTDDYHPPTADDYGNVTELNRAWLRATTELQRPQRARLADAPFLLFSLREHDLDWWRQLLEQKPQADWLHGAGVAAEPLRRLQGAALAFLWHLALRNPYAARLVSGAGVAWCDMLTAVPLVTLIDRAADRADLSTSRLGTSESTLFNADYTSAHAQVRRSSHFAALQSLLTAQTVDDHPQLTAAACSMPTPRLRVADQMKE
ncbi:MAG: hypothetical protein AAFN50_08640 [Pseudomonadota bacterium]